MESFCLLPVDTMVEWPELFFLSEKVLGSIPRVAGFRFTFYSP